MLGCERRFRCGSCSGGWEWGCVGLGVLGFWGFGVERDVCLGTSVVGGNAWDVFQF